MNLFGLLSALIAAALLLPACQTGPAAPATRAPVAAAAAPAEAAPVTPDAARNLANNCFTCHGPNGRSPGAIPSLIQLSAADIATKLKNFKTGSAPSTVMGRHAKGYGDAEIDAVARYIAGQKK